MSSNTKLQDLVGVELAECMAEVRKEAMEGHRVYPSSFEVDILKAFNYVDLDDVRVVILGGDPYPGSHSTGLAFAVPEDTAPLPKTLRIIFNEIERDVGQGELLFDETLQLWADQGVLLLNAHLTCGIQPMSHRHINWGKVTNKVLKYLSDRSDIVFVAWGREANRILMDVVDHTSNHILTASHPSPMSHLRGALPFTGSGHFMQINTILNKLGHAPIIWAGKVDYDDE